MTAAPYDHQCSDPPQVVSTPERARDPEGSVGSGKSSTLCGRNFTKDDLQLKGVCVVDTVFSLEFYVTNLKTFFPKWLSIAFV